MSDKELRELDAWIAEHVTAERPKAWFDLTSCETGFVSNSSQDQAAMLAIAAQSPNEFSGRLKVVARKEYRRYTTDPAAAMLVLEKCLAKAGSDVCFFKSADHHGAYLVFRLLDANPEKGTPHVEADTIPLAIGLFAKNLFDK